MNAFSDEYEPKTIVGRENEKQAIADYLKECSAGRNSKVLYIHGIPGIGKTTVVRATLNQFEEGSNAVIVYHNCRNSSRQPHLHFQLSRHARLHATTTTRAP